jgi:hypothetical protein
MWHLKLLATSCRVVSFGVGAVILNWLIDQAAQADAHLAADFRPTNRNRMMDIAYRFAGFTDDPCGCLAGLGPVAGGGRILHLHLIPDSRTAPTTMRLTSPDLVAGYAAACRGRVGLLRRGPCLPIKFYVQPVVPRGEILARRRGPPSSPVRADLSWDGRQPCPARVLSYVVLSWDYAARWYSLISPVTTGFRRTDRRPACAVPKLIRSR